MAIFFIFFIFILQTTNPANQAISRQRRAGGEFFFKIFWQSFKVFFVFFYFKILNQLKNIFIKLIL